MTISEVLVASSSGNSTHGSGSTIVFDTLTGTSLHQFKQNSTQDSGLIQSTRDVGGIIANVQLDKALLNIYSWQKEQLHSKVILPQKLTAFTIDKSSRFCAGGTDDGRIYLWEISSGILFRTFDAHYRRINRLSFDDSSSVLVSISDDASVNVWMVARLLDEDLQSELPTPFCSFTDHTLPVKDLYVGIGAFQYGRIFTSSLDQTVKVWSLESKSLVSTLEFPTAITSLIVDKMERFIYTSSKNVIYRIDLIERSPQLNVSEDLTSSRVIKINRDTQITSLALSIASNVLYAGTSDGFIEVYDVRSHQQLRTLNNLKNFPITNLKTILKPIDLGGVNSSASLTSNVTGSTAAAMSNLPPILPFGNLKKTINGDEKEDHTIQIKCKSNRVFDDFFDDFINTDNDDLQPSIKTTNDTNKAENNDEKSDDKIKEMETEIDNLKKSLERAQSINDKMWSGMVDMKMQRKPSESSNNNNQNKKKKAM